MFIKQSSMQNISYQNRTCYLQAVKQSTSQPYCGRMLIAPPLSCLLAATPFYSPSQTPGLATWLSGHWEISKWDNGKQVQVWHTLYHRACPSGTLPCRALPCHSVGSRGTIHRHKSNAALGHNCMSDPSKPGRRTCWAGTWAWAWAWRWASK